MVTDDDHKIGVVTPLYSLVRREKNLGVALFTEETKENCVR